MGVQWDSISDIYELVNSMLVRRKKLRALKTVKNNTLDKEIGKSVNQMFIVMVQ
jgi:hypothetical protein